MDLSSIMKLVSDPKVRNLVTQLFSQMSNNKGGSGGQANMAGLLDTMGKNPEIGDQVKSWVGTGDNKPVSPEQVTQAIGADQIQKAATAAGMSPTEAANDLSKVLPHLVDTATPAGKPPSSMPDIDSLLKQLMSGK
jgi:uncharacterized protein YidB (DUF937 family)